jgi:autotransporter-associated beta strand protein
LTDNRGTLDLNNSSTHNITVNALPSDPSGIGLSILSIIQNGGFTKKGAGILELAARNTFAGQLTVEEGGLSIAEIRNVGNDQPLSNSALAVILGGTGGKTGTLIYSGSWWGWDASSDKPFTMATGGTGGFQVGTQWGNQTPITLTLSGVIDGGGGLTKTGTGTLALTNTNTYSGDTTIEDGVLSLGMRCLDDDSTLTIGTAAGSSAVLNLPNAGTDFVAALVIDGVTMPNGTYDSTNSGGAITGAGIIQVGVSTPQIVVEENSITLSSGGTVDYGAQAVSSQTDLVFTISNSGDMPLTLNGTPMVAVSGTNAANFTVITPPTSPVAGKGSTTFTLRFIPSAVGARAATLTITSDSTTDGSFTLNLTGTGTADYSEWVKAYTGDMSTGGDPDGDGVKNQQEYAFGLNPNSGTSANPIIVPFHKTTGTFSYTRRDPSLTGLGYKILISTTLQAVSWTEDTGAVQTPGPVSGGTQTVAVQLSPSLLSASKLFMRVEAVQP